MQQCLNIESIHVGYNKSASRTKVLTHMALGACQILGASLLGCDPLALLLVIPKMS